MSNTQVPIGKVAVYRCSIKTFLKIYMKNAVLESLLKGPLSGLGQFLAFERPLKMMKNAFYFTLKARFVLKIVKFLC